MSRSGRTLTATPWERVGGCHSSIFSGRELVHVPGDGHFNRVRGAGQLVRILWVLCKC